MKMIDYRNFRLKKLTEPEYKHILLLLFWPAFGLFFYSAELFLPLNFHPVECGLDAMIPFCEWFVVPYYFWFAFIGWIMVYGFFFDIPAFKNYMWFTIISYAITAVIYLVYPTMQELRPAEFAHDNIATRIIGRLYSYDTNTNVCPSIHVIGSLAVMFSAWHSKRYSTPGWRAFFLIAAILICSSTVFLKQHSIIDIFTALPICLLTYLFVYRKILFRKKEENRQ